MLTDSPLCRVRLAKTDAVAQGLSVCVVDYAFEDLTRATLNCVSPGFIRLMIGEDADRLAGTSVFELHNNEVIQVLAVLRPARVYAGDVTTDPPERGRVPAHSAYGARKFVAKF